MGPDAVHPGSVCARVCYVNVHACVYYICALISIFVYLHALFWSPEQQSESWTHTIIPPPPFICTITPPKITHPITSLPRSPITHTETGEVVPVTRRPELVRYDPVYLAMKCFDNILI